MPRQQIPPLASFAKTFFASLRSSAGFLSNVQLYGQSTQSSTPTPAAPISIVNTTGNVNIKSDNKNLLLYNPIGNTTANGITRTYNPDGSITFNGTSTSDYSLTLSFPTPLILSGQVTHSVGVPLPALTYASLNNQSETLLNSGNQSRTWVANGVKVYPSYLIYFTSGAVLNNVTFRPQVEVGPLATTYVQNVRSTQVVPLGSLQLRSLPNGLSDRIYKSGNTWYLEQNVGSITIDGSGAWTANSSSGSPTYTYAYTSIYDSLLVTNANTNSTMSSHFAAQSLRLLSTSVVTEDTVSMGSTGGQAARFMILTSRLSSNDPTGVKAWFAANPTVANFILSTPVTTAITDPAQIAALESIATYEGITNITSGAPISATYLTNILRQLANLRVLSKLRKDPANLVVNGDFEYYPGSSAPQTIGGFWINGTSTGSLIVKEFDWAAFYFALGGNASFDTTEKYSGSASMRLGGIQVASESAVAKYRSSSVAEIPRDNSMILATPGVSYTISAMLKSIGVSGIGGSVRIRFLNKQGAILSTAVSSNAVGTTGWVPFSVTGVAPAGTYYATPFLYFQGTGDVYFDNIDLRTTTPSGDRVLVS